VVRVTRVPLLAARRAARRFRSLLSLGLAVGLVLAAREAAAEPPAVNLRAVERPTHPEAVVYLEPTDPRALGDWNVGAWVSYARRPVVVPDAASGERLAIVSDQVALDLTGGIGLGGRLALGFWVPAALYQRGETPPPALGAGKLPATALGNIAVDARTTLVRRERGSTFGLGALARLSLPTGNLSSTLGEQRLRAEVRLLADVGFFGATLRATAGARLREEELPYAGETFGHDLPFGLGLHLKPQTLGLDRSGAWLFALEGHGAISLTPSFAAGRESTAAIALAVRRTFGNVFGALGAEVPVAGMAEPPAFSAFVSVGYAPHVDDADRDGILDEVDLCAERPEDRDGFEDKDGCPEIDDDGDGVEDSADRCPGSVEDLDGVEDADGCLDPDDDRDGTPDVRDACRAAPGPADPDPAKNGCPVRDGDMDGVPDPRDRCPNRAEDRDGFADDDGCVDPDDDRDGLPDTRDRCRLEPGPAATHAALEGCPSPDRDGDALEGDADRCPEQAEDYDGAEDGDGCPETIAGEKGIPLAVLEPGKPKSGIAWELRLNAAITFETNAGSEAVSASSAPSVRAIAALLNKNPDLVLMVAVRPENASPAAEQQALTRSFALVNELRGLTYRDDPAETIGWTAIKTARGTLPPSGLGFLVLGSPAAP